MTKVKRSVSVALILTMLCSIFCISGISANAATTVSGSCGTNATYTLNKSTGKMVIKANSGKDGYVKKNFLDYTFSSSQVEAIKTIVIKDGIVEIGRHAFSCSLVNATNIETVKISVTNDISIGYGAFSENSNLTKATISTSNNDISFLQWSFSDCEKLKILSLNADSVQIKSYAFSGCSSLEKMNIPKLVGNVSESAFTECKSLKKITISYLEGDIDTAFQECTNLKKVVIKEVDSSKSHSIGSYAFYNCKSLETFTGSKNFDSISAGAFFYCTKLQKFNFSSKLTSIPAYAFEKCKSLTTLTIPKSVKNIKKYAFSNCTGLTKVTLYKSTTVNKKAFTGCTCTFKYKS